MNYSRMLRRAWRITWRSRILWLFGLLTMLDFPANVVTAQMPDDPQLLREMLLRYMEPHRIAISILGVGLPFVLIQAATRAAGKAALIDQASRIKRRGTATLRGAWDAIRRFGLRLFELELLLGVPITLLPVAAVTPLIAVLPRILTPTMPSASAYAEFESRVLPSGAALCCLALPLVAVLSLVRTLAPLECVIGDRSTGRSLIGAMRVLRNRPLQVVAMALLLACLFIGVGLGLAIPVCLWSILSLPMTAGAGQATNLPERRGHGVGERDHLDDESGGQLRHLGLRHLGVGDVVSPGSLNGSRSAHNINRAWKSPGLVPFRPLR